MILSLSYSKPGQRTHAIFKGIANVEQPDCHMYLEKQSGQSTSVQQQIEAESVKFKCTNTIPFAVPFSIFASSACQKTSHRILKQNNTRKKGLTENACWQ